jgi:vacuolar-type H+-ATPase subunit E/Vma4
MSKTKNEARAAWNEAEEEYRKVIAPYVSASNTEPIDKAALVAISKARTAAERCLDAYVRRALG